MKRHLIISSYDNLHNPVYAGGGALAIDALAKSLTKNYIVTVVTGAYPGCRDGVKGGVRYRYIGSKLFAGKLGQLCYSLCLPHYVFRLNYDLWIESFTPPFSTGFVPWFTRKPVIGLVHMLAAKDMERKYKLPFHLVENFGLTQYRSFITLSELSKAQILTHNPNAKIAVIGNGINIPSSLKPYAKRQLSYLLYLGRIEVDQKGLDLLVAAYSQIYQKSGVLLKIAGTGSSTELYHLRHLLDQAGLTDKVELLGRVEGNAKRQLLMGASCIMIPSRYETFSLTALESLSYGIPLVCFDIAGMQWIHSTVALKAPSYDPDIYAAYALSILNDRSLAFRLSRLSLRIAKQYTWSIITKKYLNFIQEHL